MQRKLTLIELAGKSEITAALLSKIENFRTMPSLLVLYKISLALAVPMSEIVFPLINSKERDYTLAKADQLEVEDRYDSDGLVYKGVMTGLVHDHLVRVNIVIMEPKTFRPPLETDGMELVHILQGSVEYGLKDDWIEMKRGDTMLFNGVIPHALRNTSSKNAVLFKVYFMN